MLRNLFLGNSHITHLRGCPRLILLLLASNELWYFLEPLFELIFANNLLLDCVEVLENDGAPLHDHRDFTHVPLAFDLKLYVGLELSQQPLLNVC